MKAVPFRTQARTVDHLGREQIADCPTAVSELWKNAWDAYATEVRLTVFAEPSPLAVIFDDGHGMSRDEFENRWLTIGTSSKVESDAPTPEADRLSLAIRPKQGRKGIGRLSIAHLGPLVVVLSKRADQPFVVAVVDWRIFENPFLRLEDVQVPIEEFDVPDQLFAILPELFNHHMENIWPSLDPDASRRERVTHSWQKYDQLEADRLPSEAVYSSAIRGEDIDDRHLKTWPAWSGDKPSGTAMIILDIYPELRCWIGEDSVGDADANTDVREVLKRSLMGFVDPYEPPETRPDFRYAFTICAQDTEREEVSPDLGVDRATVKELEHAIIGTFDETGRFEGEVRAFGRPWIPWVFTPPKPLSQRLDGKVGRFSIILGTFEIDPKSSSHPPERHAQLLELAEQYAGLFVYRDHLRLQPYGRPNHDFFRIEQRRSKHAGREFWAHRRMFGCVALTGEGNPNLRDKAGREGLIENSAMRRFRGLIEDFLMTSARRFFGTDSPDRKPALTDIQKRNEERAKAAERRHNRMNRRDFTRAIRNQEPALRSAISRVAELRQHLDAARDAGDGEQVRAIGPTLESERATRSSLQLPMRPRDLGTFEPDWRAYRDDLEEMSASLERIAHDWRNAMESLRPESPEETALSALGRHQKALHDQLRKWQAEAKRLLSDELTRLDERIAADRGRYYHQAAPIAAQAADQQTGLATILDELERIRDRFEEDLRGHYPTYIRALQRLADGIDLDAALQWSADERTTLEHRLAEVSALAQLGIAFEIIGHEFNNMQRDVMSNLQRLPVSVKQSEAFRGALTAYQALARRLNFFTPLQMAGRVARERVTGNEIGRYVDAFFGDYFARERITLDVTSAFKSFAIIDHPWRIYPVFINLLQNARYWVRQSERARVIRLDRMRDVIIVSDSGPGIDSEDGEAIFDIFFSRRRGGRGIGLYLVKVNLAAGGHTIALAQGASHHILPGANFVIRFERIEHD